MSESLVLRSVRLLKREGCGNLWRAARTGAFLPVDRRTQLCHLLNCLRFKAIADPYKVIYVRATDIEYALRVTTWHSKDVPSSSHDTHRLGVTVGRWGPLGQVRGGDWDLDVVRFTDTLKYEAIRQHFGEGVPWEQTALFQRAAGLISGGQTPDGLNSVAELRARYANVDALYRLILDYGLLPPDTLRAKGYAWNDYRIIRVAIGRTGRLISSPARQGNHRLAIAVFLGVDSIPVQVFLRHTLWQRRRDEMASLVDRHQLTGTLINSSNYHPDIDDISGLFRSA